MTIPDLDRARWRKSSYSTSQANCVEVAVAKPAAAVRDSKHPTAGTLSFPTSAWTRFLHAVATSR